MNDRTIAGYLSQRLDASGWQREEPTEWKVEQFLKELPERITVTLESRTVHIRAWRYEVKGVSDFTCLDDLSEQAWAICIRESEIKRANIARDAVLVGMFDRFEIWAPERYESILWT